jgi:biopolymer transport protein ExbD
MARKSKFQEEVEDLNLIPIMNLVLCLIPAVLFKTQLVKMGILEAQPPQIASAPSPTPPDPDKKPLGLSLTIEKDKLIIAASDNQLSAPDFKPEELEIGMDSKQAASPGKRHYDYVKLYKVMAKIRVKFKEDHHKKEVLKLKAKKDTPFKYVVRIMDILRYKIKSDQDISTIDKLSKVIKDKKFEGIEGTKSYVRLWYGVSFDKPLEDDAAQGKKIKDTSDGSTQAKDLRRLVEGEISE